MVLIFVLFTRLHYWKIIEKLARINEVSSTAAEPIPWRCEVFLWEQGFNFVTAEDRGAEQIGSRLESVVRGPGVVRGSQGYVRGGGERVL